MCVVNIRIVSVCISCDSVIKMNLCGTFVLVCLCLCFINMFVQVICQRLGMNISDLGVYVARVSAGIG